MKTLHQLHCLHSVCDGPRVNSLHSVDRLHRDRNDCVTTASLDCSPSSPADSSGACHRPGISRTEEPLMACARSASIKAALPSAFARAARTDTPQTQQATQCL